MYEANSPKELKKLLKEDKFPILVTDSKTQEIVLTMESLKKKGFVDTMTGKGRKEILRELKREKGIGIEIEGDGKVYRNAAPVLNQGGIIALAIIGCATIIALYAIYKNKDTELEFSENGVKVKAKNS